MISSRANEPAGRATAAAGRGLRPAVAGHGSACFPFRQERAAGQSQQAGLAPAGDRRVFPAFPVGLSPAEAAQGLHVCRPVFHGFAGRLWRWRAPGRAPGAGAGLRRHLWTRAGLALVLLILGGPLATRGGEPARFLTAGQCALCHTRIRAPEHSAASEEFWIGPAALWQGTMMSLAAKDPYWRAKTAFETAAHPRLREAIEDKCTRCHAPAQQYPLRSEGRRLAVSALDDLGRDGVTCTVCHRIGSDPLGSVESFTGGFAVSDEWVVFGPHSRPFTMPMVMHTGYTPAEGRHVLEAALCGSCHTVITQPGGSAAAPAFAEQAPFLEWLASSFRSSGRTCQSCHMPVLSEGGAPVRQYIAHRPPGGPFPPTAPRAPFGLHLFAGGNTVIPALLAGGPEPPAARRARQMLSQAMQLRLEARRTGRHAVIEVDAVNLAGHKLPTGYPGRRLWIHLTVKDAQNRTVFESGAWDPATARLVSGESFHPHHAVLVKPEQVQIFEAEMEDLSGRLTVSLTAAARFRKDNRILPRGFDSAELVRAGFSAAWAAPAGIAPGARFAPGMCRTTYRVPVSVPGRLTIRAEALYQSIKPSHLPPGFEVPASLLAPVAIGSAETVLE